MSYQVTGACVIVTTSSPVGPQKITMYAPALLPPDVPQREIDHLLSVGLIAEVGAKAPAAAPAVPADGQGGEGGSEPPGPTPGGKPSQGDPKAAWVEYAVSQGVDRAEAEKASKADLVGMFKS